MARVQIPFVVQDEQGNALNGTARVYLRDTTTNADVYAAATGGAPLTQPLTVTDGKILGYVEVGSYDVVATVGSLTWTRKWEAVRPSSFDALSATTPDKIAWEYPAGTDVVEVYGQETPAGTLVLAWSDPATVDLRSQYDDANTVAGGFGWLSATGQTFSRWGYQPVRWNRMPKTSLVPAQTGPIKIVVRLGIPIATQIDPGGPSLAMTSQVEAGLLAQWNDNTRKLELWDQRPANYNTKLTETAAAAVGTEGLKSDRYVLLQRNGDGTITAQVWLGDPDVGGSTLVTALTNYTLPSPADTRYGAGTSVRPAIIVNDLANPAYINDVRVYLGSQELRDLIVAVTPAGGSRTTKRLFGSNGVALRSDFAQLVAAGTGQALQLPTFTLATRPSAVGLTGTTIYVSDAPAGQRVQSSNGTTWEAQGGGASGAAGGDLTGTYPNPTVVALTGDANQRTTLATGAALDWPVDAPTGVTDEFGSDTSANFPYLLNTTNPNSTGLFMTVSGGTAAFDMYEQTSQEHKGRYDNRTLMTGDVQIRYQIISLTDTGNRGWGVGAVCGYQTGDGSCISGFIYESDSIGDGQGYGRIMVWRGSDRGFNSYLTGADFQYGTGGNGTRINANDWFELKKVGNVVTMTLYGSDGTTVKTRFTVTLAGADATRFGTGTQGYSGPAFAGPNNNGFFHTYATIDHWSVTQPGAVRTNVRRIGVNLTGSDADWQARDLVAQRYLVPPSYTMATRPTAVAGTDKVIYVSDAPAGQRLQYSNGTIWLAPSQLVPINTQTGTTYTLVLTDAGGVVEGNNAAAMTYTIPPNSSVAFPVGTRIRFVRVGAGTMSIAPGAGVTIPNRLEAAGTTTRTVSAQFGVVDAYQRATNQWVLSGDIA